MPTIAQYTQMILATERQVRTWKRRRKTLVLSAKAKEQHRDPVFAERVRAGRASVLANPLLNAQRIEKIRRTMLAKPNALPAGFTIAIRSKLHRMIAAGASREDAIAALLAKPSVGRLPPPCPALLSPTERARSLLPAAVDAR